MTNYLVYGNNFILNLQQTIIRNSFKLIGSMIDIEEANQNLTFMTKFMTSYDVHDSAYSFILFLFFGFFGIVLITR